MVFANKLRRFAKGRYAPMYLVMPVLLGLDFRQSAQLFLVLIVLDIRRCFVFVYVYSRTGGSGINDL